MGPNTRSYTMMNFLKYAAMIQVLIMSMSMFDTNLAQAQDRGFPSETPAQSSSSSAQSSVAPAGLTECLQDLDVSTASHEELVKRLELCDKAKKELQARFPAPAPRPAAPQRVAPRPAAPQKPLRCETPDKEILPAGNGTCVEECADSTHLGTPEHVPVEGETARLHVCVLRRVSITDLTGRVEALEGDTRELRALVEALKKLTGDQYTALFTQLNTIVTELQRLDERIDALEAAIAAQDARDDGQDDEIAKARAAAEAAKKNRSVQLVRITGLAEAGYVGDAGANLAFGGRLEYENRFTADSIASFFAGVGTTVSPVHQDNTFGTIYMPFVDAGVRLHTSDSHKFGIDLGVMYQVRLDGHPAGYLGKPSQYDGSNFGPSVGFMWNFHRHMHLMGRGTVGFGPENHLEGNRIALEYPVQPRFFLGFGGTIGL